MAKPIDPQTTYVSEESGTSFSKDAIEGILPPGNSLGRENVSQF